MTTLKQRAIRGIVWTIASYGTSQILRLGSNLILTRLLFPELFGLMSLVNIFIAGLHLFSDIGVGPSIIQNKRGDDPVFLNTAWTLQVIRSLVIWLGCVLIAWPIANFYAQPQFMWLVPIVGLSTIISGFNSTALYTLNRHMALGQLAIFELGGQIVSLAVMLIWAWFNPSIWSLVAGGLSSAVVQMVWSHRLTSGSPNRFVWNQEAAEEIFAFGKWIFVSTALYFLAAQADRLILGKLFSLEMLGVYGIAFVLADMPRQVITRISSSVIFPLVSQQAYLPRHQLRAKILEKRKFILVGMAFLLTILISLGDFLILALYDQRYAEAAWMMPILALGLWPCMLLSTMNPCLLALGQSRYEAQGSLLKFITISVGLPLGYFLLGNLGAVIVVGLGELPVYGAILYGLWREQLACIEQDMKTTALFFGSLAVAVLGRFVLGFGLPIDGLL